MAETKILNKLKECSLPRFLGHLKESSKDTNKRFCFILGAGASVESGIASGADLAQTWVEELEKTDDASKQWLEDKQITKENASNHYTALFGKRFELDHAVGCSFLEALMEGKEPSCGYAALAQILALGQHNVVITTNFDSLTEDALFIYTRKKPLVVGHASLANFIRPNQTRPIIAKIHNDLFLSPKNTSAGTEKMDEKFEKPLQEVFKYFTPVVIGYGGNDGSMMTFLEQVNHEEKTLFWFHRTENGALPKNIQKLVIQWNGFVVPITGFDSAMMQMASILDLPHAIQGLKETTNDRIVRYLAQVEKLNLKNDQETKEAVNDTTDRSKSSWWVWQLKVNAEEGVDEKDSLYQEGIKDFPQSVELMNNYALFLQTERKDFDQAEGYYQRALKADPNQAITLANYAYFLVTKYQDFDQAEDYYQRALKADPNQASILGNYAIFLETKRKDFDQAEDYYQQALKADPNHAKNLGNYALFLETKRKDFDQAEDYYQRALKADPNQAITLTNYALFLETKRKDFDQAEDYYQRALKADPNQATTLGNYANFLETKRKDFDQAADYYQRALKADPNQANILANYALFLHTKRKDFDQAEDYYQQALKADPHNVNCLGNYALFLQTERKDFDQAEGYYQRALKADPNQAITLANYAYFLVTKYQDFDQAEDYYQRALKADPNQASILGNYALFLHTKRKDFDQAEDCYQRALKADPNQANNLVNYGMFLLENNKLTEAKNLFDQADEVLGDEPSELLLELWFYRYAGFWEIYSNAAEQVEAILSQGIRSVGWSLEGVVNQAEKMEHPNLEQVKAFAKKISSEPSS